MLSLPKTHQRAESGTSSLSPSSRPRPRPRPDAPAIRALQPVVLCLKTLLLVLVLVLILWTCTPPHAVTSLHVALSEARYALPSNSLHCSHPETQSARPPGLARRHPGRHETSQCSRV